MFTKRRTCPASSRKCLTIAGKRFSISLSNSGSVAELHSIDWTPSVNRRSAVGISTVIFISIVRFLTPKFGNNISFDLWADVAPAFRRASARINSVGLKADATNAPKNQLISRDRGHAVVDERLKLRQPRRNGRRERVFLRNGVNRFQAISGYADHRRFIRADVSLPDQFPGDAGCHASGGLRENPLGFGQKLNALHDFWIGDIFRPAATLADRARGIKTIRRIPDGERPRNRGRFLRLKLIELALHGI